LAGWNERRGILVIYRAEPIGGMLAAHDDVSDARWFAPAEIPWATLAFESTAQVLREWAGRSCVTDDGATLQRSPREASFAIAQHPCGTKQSPPK
jgi:hypothetical protein